MKMELYEYLNYVLNSGFFFAVRFEIRHMFDGKVLNIAETVEFCYRPVPRMRV